VQKWGENATTFLKLKNPKNYTLSSSVIVTIVVILIIKMGYLTAHSFIHLFNSLACAECKDSLPFSAASSIPVIYFFLPPFSTH
jgi:hypothetical protein